MHHPTDRTAHTTAFVTPVVEQWLKREISIFLLPSCDVLLTRCLNAIHFFAVYSLTIITTKNIVTDRISFHGNALTISAVPSVGGGGEGGAQGAVVPLRFSDFFFFFLLLLHKLVTKLRFALPP